MKQSYDTVLNMLSGINNVQEAIDESNKKMIALSNDCANVLTNVHKQLMSNFQMPIESINQSGNIVLNMQEMLKSFENVYKFHKVDYGVIENLANSMKGIIEINSLKQPEIMNLQDILFNLTKDIQNYNNALINTNFETNILPVIKILTGPNLTNTINAYKEAAKSLNYMFQNNQIDYQFDLEEYTITEKETEDFLLEYNSLPLDDKNKLDIYLANLLNIFINGKDEMVEFFSKLPKKFLLILEKLKKSGVLETILIILTIYQILNPAIINNKTYIANNNTYITNINNFETDSQYLYYIYKGNAIIRELPNRKSNLLFKLENGVKIKLIDISNCSNWYLIEFKKIIDGNEVKQSGWVSKANVRKLK